MLANLGALASMALVANAILLPPPLTAEDLGDDLAMETLQINPYKRTVALECPGCPSASLQGNALSWTQDTGNSFLLDLEIGPREDTLEIDGARLYPPAFGQFSEPFYVTQVLALEEPLRLPVTGYAFHFNSGKTVTEAGTELLPMTLRIVSIESQPVNLPVLTINLLKDATGRLMIASFQTAKAEEGAIGQDSVCKEWPLLCKWRAMLAEKMNGVKNSISKGCHKGMKMGMGHKAHGKPHPEMHSGGHHHPHHKPHHYGQEGHHHAHRYHRASVFLRRAFFTILIPILIGIFAGILTYLLGLALGCLIAVIVTKVRGYGPYERVPGMEDEEEAGPRSDNEKEVYAELPEYDAPPVYEEAAEKEVVNDSH